MQDKFVTKRGGYKKIHVTYHFPLQFSTLRLILIITLTRSLIPQIYFWNKALHVSDSSYVHHQEFFILHTAMVYVIQVCWQLARGTELHLRPDPARKLPANLYDIYYCRVYNEKTPNDGQRNCPKHVELYSKNKSEKLVHLVSVIIRIKRKVENCKGKWYVTWIFL